MLRDHGYHCKVGLRRLVETAQPTQVGFATVAMTSVARAVEDRAVTAKPTQVGFATVAAVSNRRGPKSAYADSRQPPSPRRWASQRLPRFPTAGVLV